MDTLLLPQYFDKYVPQKEMTFDDPKHRCTFDEDHFTPRESISSNQFQFQTLCIAALGVLKALSLSGNHYKHQIDTHGRHEFKSGEL